MVPAAPPAAAAGETARRRIWATAPGRAGRRPSSTARPASRYSAAIKGTTTPATRAIRRMPPRMTARARTAVTAPVIRAGTPKLPASAAATELDWAIFPHPQGGQHRGDGKEKRQGSPQAPLPEPQRMVYMGPPRNSPRPVFRRYFTASRHSAHLEDRPSRAESSIHTRAPGPPATRAVATPAMLPVPMVAARVVIRAERGETSPPSPADRASRLKVLFSAQPRFRQGRKRVRRVRKAPVPTSSASIQGPQTSWSIRAAHWETDMGSLLPKCIFAISISEFCRLMPEKARTPGRVSAPARRVELLRPPCAVPGRRRWSAPACTPCRR